MFLGRQDRRSGSTKWAAHSASPSHQPKTHQCWANATARQSGLTQCIGKTLCELPSLEPVIACSHWCFGAGDDRLRRKAAVAFVGEVGAKRATKTSPEMLNLTHQFCGRDIKMGLFGLPIGSFMGGLIYRFAMRSHPIHSALRGHRLKYALISTVSLPLMFAGTTGLRAQGLAMAVLGLFIGGSIALGILVSGDRRVVDDHRRGAEDEVA